ncbi:MAG TPA: outer membrane beta-barrel protein [Bacteroidota bacterium]|jgi:outer membrane protein OmpA-like peptidoglycan-associated protein
MNVRTGSGRRIPFFILLALAAQTLLNAQESRRLQPQWWFGGAVGPNFNTYSSDINSSQFYPPGYVGAVPSLPSFTKGTGAGVFLSPLLEYRPDPVWGGMLMLGFDGRGGSFTDVSGSGVTRTLRTSLNYISLEPSVRATPFSAPLYFFAGPRLGFSVSKSYTFTEVGGPEFSGDWTGSRGTVFGAQIGAGYDIPISDPNSSSQIELSPFVAFHFGQGPRSEESWTLTTLRAGLALKFGSGSEARQTASGEVQFAVRAPKLIPVERKVKETFPMRNCIFFDEGSNTIPARYISLTQSQASSFREEQLVQPEPKDLSGRSRRQLTVYHNILNVLGDRMRRHPSATLKLSGASEQGASNGRELAEAVKRYLVDLFGIDGGRIVTDGRTKPEIPSMQSGASRELELVRPEDRRVDISSPSPELLEPDQIISLQEDPLDSDVLFSVAGAQDVLASWSIVATDENGAVKRFGPFTSSEERVSGRAILGDRLQGKYTVVLDGITKSGQSIQKDETIRLVRSDQPEEEPGLRFSILFEFDQSKTVATYERFLSGTVAPLIPAGGSVIIHGHTDIVGEESHNLKLSRDRAQETMAILQRELARAGKRNVKFDTYGFGEDVRRAPFDNRLPEERFYNRTVIIDILPE